MRSGIYFKPVVAPYDPSFDIQSFNCGLSDINSYLQQKAINQERDKITKLFVIHLEKRVIAYCAVFCSHLFFRLPNQVTEFRVPGLCLGQLGVDLNYQGKGLGNLLVEYCISIARKIGEYAGCRILFLEAHDTAIKFYHSLRFHLLERKINRNRMFLDLI